MNAYFNVAIYGPVLKDQAKLPAFDGTNPILAGLLDLAQAGHRAGLSGRLQHRLRRLVVNNFIIPKMMQRVVIDGWDFDKAMDEAQTQGQAIYDKY